MLAQILKLWDIFKTKNCPHTSLHLFHEDCVLAKAIKALQSQADESLRQKRRGFAPPPHVGGLGALDAPQPDYAAFPSPSSLEDISFGKRGWNQLG